MENSTSITESIISDKIYSFRGHQVLLDFDLAQLYQVETKQLKRQVRRNIERFPADFMFELTPEEYSSLRSQFGTLKRGEHIKYSPMAFTEQGVAMLSSVLNSNSAIDVNIQIMRIFTKIRHLLIDQTEIRLEIQKIKNTLDIHDTHIQQVFNYLDGLLQSRNNPEPRTYIGYKSYDQSNK